METIRNLPSKDIPSILEPTFKAFIPLLVANKDKINAIPRTTYTYGPHPRQNLDIYPSSTSSNSTSPILVFLYGGGLTRGDKILAPVPGGLVYHNLGTFFAQQGYTTVVVDYRRVNDSKLGTGEDATFPSGGEDLSLALKFLNSHFASEGSSSRDVFVMGNSAGGLHTATFLFQESFRKQRLELLSGSGVLKLKGGILLSVPCDFDGASSERTPMLSAYYPASYTGSAAAQKAGHAARELEPRALLAALGKDGSVTREEVGVPPVLLLEGELDPEDEILASMGRFSQAWAGVFDGTGKKDLETQVLAGHNHISPPLGLMCGEESAEQWGKDVVAWCKKQSSS